MTLPFSIVYNDELIQVSQSRDSEENYELIFSSGEEKIVANTERGWRYVLPYRTDPVADEDELLSEESSIELGLEIEAEAIGELIDKKLKDQAS